MTKINKILALLALFLCINFSALAQEISFADELIRMEAQDQQMRQSLVSAKDREDIKAKILASDKEHVEYVKSAISNEGWSLVKSLSPEQVDALFLIIIHASFDVEFQKEALQKLEENLPEGSNYGQKYALLTDKILISQGKEQVYGTQYEIVDGEVSIKPVKNWDNLNQLRKENGMPPIDIYIKILEEMNGIKDHGLL